jgi:ABC-type multidrug transport system fused ATPase/permease subunit
MLELVRGKSLLLITHHLIGMERMDEILVLDDGKIVDRGTHEELLRKPGLYARMWRLQHKEVELV